MSGYWGDEYDRRSAEREAERRKREAARLRRWVIGVGVVLVALIGFVIWQTTVLNGFLLGLRAGWFYWLLTVVAVALLATGFFREADDRTSWPFWLLGVAALLTMIPFGIAHNYQKNHAIVGASVEQTADPIPSFDPRAPFVVASNQTTSHVTTNGNLGETTYIPDSEHFGALVADRGLTAGYREVVWQELSESGQSRASNCEFVAERGLRFGGWFGANMTRAVIRAAGYGTVIDESDAYGACVDGKPIVVVPIKQYAGGIFPYQVSAGVAVYDGVTGELTIDRDVEAGEYPGPVYPMSLAAAQRDATKAMGSWWDMVRSRVGYKSTDDEDSANNAEFNVHRADGTGDDFVTPLSLVGRAQSIAAVGYVPSNEARAGRLNTLTIATLPEPRQANTAVIDRLRADHGSLPQWAAGMAVFEVIPTGPDTWRATMGMPKAVQFWADIQADGSSVLYSATTGEKVADSASSQDATTTDPTGPSGLPDLSTLSNEQLAQLLREAADRLGAAD